MFKDSGIFNPGVSKHAEKETAREKGAKTWSALGKELNIYSYNTAETYKQVWHDFGQWAKAEAGLKDIEKTTGEHVKAYLESRIVDGIKYTTYEKECAALAKFENALNAWSDKHSKDNEYNFRDSIREIKAEAREVLDRSVESRAYESPKELISHIANDDFKTVASVQYEGGARLNEVWRVETNDLRGIRMDPHTEEFRGWLVVEGKGGKEREISVSVETYHTVERVLQENGGNMEFDKNDYREAIKEAAEKTEQDYTGSHGLRWNFAVERMEELQGTGMTYEERLQEVSWEMGHERADITLHYLSR